MKNFNTRLDRLENAVSKDKHVIFNIRYDHEDEDFERQKAEYIQAHGDVGNVMFIGMIDYRNAKIPAEEEWIPPKSSKVNASPGVQPDPNFFGKIARGETYWP